MKKTMVATLSVVALVFAGTSQADAPKAGSTAKAHTHEPAQAEGMPSINVPADARAATATADRFNNALHAGDLKTVEVLLDPDVLILESGGAERSRKQYLGHHALADAKFLKDAHVQLMQRTARRSGDLVWVGSESEIHTQKGDKPLTLLSTESMILKQVGDDWRIVHIHWSSRPKS
ncbi:MAG TPA: nuclear transport factor 2 family protein [Dokdonella sp.]|uniref:YybH family protein n=1 Tax=Dokdonella sp. TaxID=2291710 RepID=UPI002D807E9E|nr:nuclear transport factor 2 family protein [Dokdonella sp.]HET9031484.1 nuclear transport factor 2 family protein [Dokdonella sp.]